MKRRLDCIIAVPNFEDVNKKHEFSNTEMLGPAYVAASIEFNGYSVELLNAYSNHIEINEILRKIKENQPYVVGVTCASQRSYSSVKNFVGEVRKQGYDGKIVIGGFYATLEPERILLDLPEIDAVNTGEGEETFVKILKSVIQDNTIPNIQGVAYRTEEGVCIYRDVKLNNLDFQFYPKRFRVEKFAVSNMIDGKYIKGKYYNMTAGRGCYGRCSFCSIPKGERNKGKRYRSPENVVKEMEQLKYKYGAEHIWFNDEIFFEQSKKGLKWVNDFCRLLKEKRLDLTFNIELRSNDIRRDEMLNLKEVGLTAVFIGIESGVQRILDEMRKDVTVEQNMEAIHILKELDIKIEMGWISILPTMTFEELCQNYKFLFSTGCYTEENIYNRLNLYGGCAYEEILKGEGLLKPNLPFYERFGYNFRDYKVGYFAQIMNEVREEFSKVRKEMMPIQEYISVKGEYDEYLFIRERSREIWTKFTNELIEYFRNIREFSFESCKQSDFYVRLLKEIEALVRHTSNTVHRLKNSQLTVN